VVNNPVNLVIIREQVRAGLNNSCNIIYIIKKLKLGLHTALGNTRVTIDPEENGREETLFAFY